MIRWINTTSCLPVDEDIESSFFSILTPSFLEDVTDSQSGSAIDVFFVNPNELNQDRIRLQALEKGELDDDIEKPWPDDNRENDSSPENIPDMDLLGVYFPHHPDYHRPLIKVCPEKVMSACLLLKTKFSVDLCLVDLYTTLLHAVIIHELAHSLMDDGWHYHYNYWHRRRHLSWLADRLEVDNTIPYDFWECHCHYHANSMSPKLRRKRYIIEESLANAFVLKQKFNPAQLDALQSFIGSQLSAYKAGLRWTGSNAQILATASSWRYFKGWFSETWNCLVDPAPSSPVNGVLSPLDDLIDTLLGNIKPSPVSFNFKNSFYEYIALKLPEWQDYFEQDKLKWDHCLNEKEGIFAAATCRSAGYGISSKQRLKYLRQWASNGSLTAAEYLIDANSDSTSSDTNPAYAVLTDPQKNFIQCLSTNHSSDLSRYVLGNTLVIPGKAKCDYLLIKNWKETHLPLQIIFKKSLQRLFIMGCAIADLETNLFSPEFIHVHIQNCPNLSKLPTAIVSYTLSGLGNHFEFNLPDNTCTQAPVQITVDQLNSRSIKPLFDGRHSGYKFVAATSQNNDDKFLAIVNQCLTAGKNFRYFMAACVSAGFEDRLLN